MGWLIHQITIIFRNWWKFLVGVRCNACPIAIKQVLVALVVEHIHELLSRRLVIRTIWKLILYRWPPKSTVSGSSCMFDFLKTYMGCN